MGGFVLGGFGLGVFYLVGGSGFVSRMIFEFELGVSHELTRLTVLFDRYTYRHMAAGQRISGLWLLPPPPGRLSQHDRNRLVYWFFCHGRLVIGEYQLAHGLSRTRFDLGGIAVDVEGDGHAGVTESL